MPAETIAPQAGPQEIYASCMWAKTRFIHS